MLIPFLDATADSLELLDESQKGIWIADNHGRIVLPNRALARLSGYGGHKGRMVPVMENS
ncbi:MAG TPA: PAS domain S-box protein [bacterium]|nr:PAS domain S-box protein [bacterium]